MRHAEDLSLTRNKLNIKNPQKVQGFIRFIFCIATLLLIYTKSSAIFDKTLQFVDEILVDGKIRFQAVESIRLWNGITFTICSVILTLIAIIIIINMISAVRSMLSLFVPVHVPGPISEKDVLSLFKDRTITTYSKPTRFINILCSVFSERLRFVTGDVHRLIYITISSLKFWLILLSLLVIPKFISIDNPDLAWIINSIPMPVYLIGIVGLAFIVRLSAIVASIPCRPDVYVSESRKHQDNTGNPVNFHNYINHVLNVIRYKNFENRIISNVPPRVGRTERGQTDSFSCRLLAETQPVPIHRGFALNSIILLIGSAIMCIYAIFIITAIPEKVVITDITGFNSLSDSQRARLMFNIIISGLSMVFACFIALKIGSSLNSWGKHFAHKFRFASKLYWINVNGTYSASNIGIGDGRGGQLYSQRVVMQGDSYITLYATRIITECHSLDEPRVMLTTKLSVDFERELEYLLNEIENYDDAGKLAGIQPDDKNIHNIMAANNMINQANAAAMKLNGFNVESNGLQYLNTNENCQN